MTDLLTLVCAHCGATLERHPAQERRRKANHEGGPYCNQRCGRLARHSQGAGGGRGPQRQNSVLAQTMTPEEYLSMTGDPMAAERAAMRVAEAIQANRRYRARSAADKLPHDPSRAVNRLPEWDRCLALRAGLLMVDGEAK